MNKTLLLGAALAAIQINATATPSVAHSVQSITSLDSSINFTTFGGLMQDGDTLYYGNFNTVKSYNQTTGTSETYATIPGNHSTKGMAKVGSSIYMALDTHGAPLYQSDVGIVHTGGFTATLPSGSATGETTYSIYDATVYNDSYYFSANTGSINNDLTGTSIYRYDVTTHSSPIEIATIGGASGGLTFDRDGNLYYASQNDGEGVLKFDASAVATGGLVATDGTTVLDIIASSLEFLSTGELVAETGYGQALASYDVATGEKTSDIASTSGWDYMGDFVVDADDNIHLLSTDYGTYTSTLSTIAIPEPSTVSLLLCSAVGICAYRRQKRT